MTVILAYGSNIPASMAIAVLRPTHPPTSPSAVVHPNPLQLNPRCLVSESRATLRPRIYSPRNACVSFGCKLACCHTLNPESQNPTSSHPYAPAPARTRIQSPSCKQTCFLKHIVYSNFHFLFQYPYEAQYLSSPCKTLYCPYNS